MRKDSQSWPCYSDRQCLALCTVMMPPFVSIAMDTPEQIRQLSKEKLSSDVPMMYTMAAQRGLPLGSELMFRMELNQLMYPGLHDYNAAVKAFQTDLADKPTGVLTVWQIHQLAAALGHEKPPPSDFLN